MAQDYHHGVRVEEINEGTRTILAPDNGGRSREANRRQA